MTLLPPTRTDPLDTEHHMLWCARNPHSRAGFAKRRYPTALLDLAAKLAFENGLKEAASATGVNLWSIKKHQARLRKQGKLGYVPTKTGVRMGRNSPIYKPKYSEATMKAVFLSGVEEHKATGRPLRGCVLRAAKAYGIKQDRYVWDRYVLGLLKL